MTTGGGVRAAFSPDGGTLAVASADGRLKTFDTGEFFRLEKEMKEKEREKRGKRRKRRRRRHVFFLPSPFSALSLSLVLLAPSARQSSAPPPDASFSLGTVARGDAHLYGGKFARIRSIEG